MPVLALSAELFSSYAPQHALLRKCSSDLDSLKDENSGLLIGLQMLILNFEFWIC